MEELRQTPRSLNLPKKFKFWRDGQYEAIEAITQSQKPVFLLDAPTGTGKSLVGIGSYSNIAKIQATLEQLKGGEEPQRYRCVYVTRTKQLQNQILKEFSMSRAVMGRRNYPCLLRENDFPNFTAEDCSPGEKKAMCVLCPYLLAKSEALRAPVAVLNDAYFLGETSGPGQFSGCSLLVLDEIDSQEGSLMSFIQLSLSENQLKRMKLVPPTNLKDAATWVVWAGHAQFEVARQMESLDRQLVLPMEQWSDVEILMQKGSKRLENFGKKLALFSELVNDNWVFTFDDNEEGNWKVIFKPIQVAPYAERYLWRHGDRALGMSGSIFDPNILATDMGIEDFDYLRLDSPFPVENRPIYYKPVANVTRKRMWEELPKLNDEIIKILDKHANDRVLIHTVSYKIRDYLMNHLPQQRLITHTTADREEILNKFRHSTEPLVLISPSSDRGLDLPQESCRCIIIAKIPYLDLSDRQIKARMELPGGNRWYNLKTAQTLVQMSGRGVRSNDDYCDCVGPEMRVLTKDLKWVRAGNLRIGDELLAFDEKVKNTKMRRWCSAGVVNTGVKYLPRYLITLETGEELVSTPNHRWITKEGQYRNGRWVRTDQLKAGHHLMRYLFPWWWESNDYDTGWLGGLCDGEACLTLNQGFRHQNVTALVISQNNGEVLEKAKSILKRYGFWYVLDDKHSCQRLNIRGGFPEHLRFLGQFRPVRLLRKLEYGQAFKAQKPVRIKNVESIDPGPMVTLQSSSETYITEGFGAHNTYILDKQFTRLLAFTQNILPKWWLEAIIRGDKL